MTTHVRARAGSCTARGGYPRSRAASSDGRRRLRRYPGRRSRTRARPPSPYARPMIIRILLLLGLGAIGWLVFLRRNRLPFHIVTVFLMLGAGAVAVVFPQLTNDLARLVGVGRGADLVTYLAIVGVLFVLIHYYTKFVELQ